MKEYILAVVTHPLTVIANGGISIFTGIGTVLGIFNAVLGSLIVIVTLATTIMGFYFKYRKEQLEIKIKEQELHNIERK